MTADEAGSGSGAGNWSLAGFDYQVDVSVWLALDLMVAARLAFEMTLEHVSEEDIEADVDELEPGEIADALPMRGYRLIVQAKRRTGNGWTEAVFLSLLNHGKRRKSAMTRLIEDPSARYLLVTSAALNAPVRDLGVRRAGFWPAANRAPASITISGKDIAGRVAIIGGQDDERLVSDIKTLLLERFRVPRARWEACHEALRAAARSRMRGTGGPWKREEVEHAIAAHEGYLVGGPERDGYVEPTNWGDLTQALTNHHAVMIIGQSGSGKTATAEALWLERKAAIPDLKRVHITHGPDQLRTDTTLPPVLYDIEDPWGRFKFEPDSRPWNDQLAPAFRSARHDRLFVATSRSDVAASSRAVDSIEQWRVSLNAENYGHRERQVLFRNLMKGLPPDLAAFAHAREPIVLQKLGLPLELRKFFDALPGLDRDELAKSPEAALTTAIERAHRDSIERTVVDQIEARAAVQPAAILWGLIKPHGRLSIDVLRSLEDPLVDADRSLEDTIGPLVDSFVTARNFRQGADGSLAYYHGKVEAGIEAVLAAHPQVVRRSLRLLIDVLLARDDTTGGTWGIETAAQIIQLSDRIPNITPQPNRPGQDLLDAWIEIRLKSEGRDLGAALELAAAVGSPRSNSAELARWFEHRPDREFPRFMYWGKPERPEAWYARMRADPNVRAIVEAFVRTTLPTDNADFPTTFASDLAALAGDVTGAFLSAAEASVGLGSIRNADVIAAGALADLDAFETVVDAAAAILQPNAAELEKEARDHLLVLNAEVNEDYAEYLATNEDGVTATAYLEAYVTRVRDERGWRPLAEHRHLGLLRHYWLRALAARDVSPMADEVDAVADASYATEDEHWLWPMLTTHWHERFADRLLRRMLEGNPEPFIRQSAHACFVDHLADRMPQIVNRLVSDNSDGRLAQLALDLAHHAARQNDPGGFGLDTGHRLGADENRRHAVLLFETLPEPFHALAQAELAVQEDRVPVLSTEAAAAVAAIIGPPEDVRAARVRLAKHVALDAREDTRWILASSSDRDNALAAIDVAIQWDMTAEVNAALAHKFAHVAARALTTIAGPLPAPLPDAILDCAQRDSSPVRKALLDQLEAKPHFEHLPALRLLVGDQWSDRQQRGNDDGEFPIARRAVEAITALEAVPDDVLGSFLDDAKTTEDLVLMNQFLTCVVRHGNSRRQAEVVAMSRKGSRIAVGRAAANALFAESEQLREENIALLTIGMVLRLPASIAGSLAATIGLRADVALIDGLSDRLAASDDRKIFLAILAWVTRDRDAARANAIAERLPHGHPARRWAAGEEVVIDRAILIDLGDASAVEEAFWWMSRH